MPAPAEAADDAAQVVPNDADTPAQSLADSALSTAADGSVDDAADTSTDNSTDNSTDSPTDATSSTANDRAAELGAEAPAGNAPLNPAATAARLAELFPALFGPGVHKPLKLRVQVDVQARAPGVFAKKALSAFLQRHTTSTAYLKALSQASERVDLDGQPAGPISDEHREAALAELKRRRGIVQERRAAAHHAQRQRENEARRIEQQARDRQRALEARAASERGALLRAYETSTLTRANFCALKRLAEDELEATLAQARRDRELRREAAHAGPAAASRDAPSNGGRPPGSSRLPGLPASAEASASAAARDRGPRPPAGGPRSGRGGPGRR